MAIGKNKRLTKGKKGSKKKVVDVFTKKEWYDVKAPAYFNNRQLGKTLVTRSVGTKLAADGLRGRVFEVALGDLNGDDNTFRKVRFVCEDVYERDLLLNFHGMDLTADKKRSLVKKWQTMIQAFVDVKTTDGYVLRVFCIGFTKRQKHSTKKTAYAQTSQIKAIRQKMRDVVQNEASTCDLKQLVGRLITEEMGREIEKAVKSIYPLHNVFLKKVKVLKKPRADTAKLYELHGILSSKKKAGKKAAKAKAKTGFVEPKPLTSV
ncbi:40S ribosomal protein S3a-1 [Salpingoeca rosetta]|uniref:Small ribosomal subunit protein eS1 n=1 Tax=Salpingoeca rosetta (strain ATCC 50818 / BSB-021) TaxID=946362 RepID=F2ULI5_SALR5|nr:40S ribosomal protein S3a-1 [Salpingoeca rosetta]EGD77984.1 40S ribosomal protein S3a-1 [Salpingoeca rosetta]|eukprot:XP_004990046.1 40S ribosomal protein S3a-1 [Salpingoeca rosetta]